MKKYNILIFSLLLCSSCNNNNFEHIASYPNYNFQSNNEIVDIFFTTDLSSNMKNYTLGTLTYNEISKNICMSFKSYNFNQVTCSEYSIEDGITTNYFTARYNIADNILTMKLTDDCIFGGQINQINFIMTPIETE